LNGLIVSHTGRKKAAGKTHAALLVLLTHESAKTYYALETVTLRVAFTSG